MKFYHYPDNPLFEYEFHDPVTGQEKCKCKECEKKMKNEKSSKSANVPKKHIRIGAVSASIWANDGEKGTMYNTTIQKSYMDSDGKFQNTPSLGVNDIPKAVRVLQKAYDFILSGNEEDDE